MHRLYAPRGACTRHMQLFTNMGAPLFLLPLYNYVILIHLPTLPLTLRTHQTCFFSSFYFLFFEKRPPIINLFFSNSMGSKTSREDEGGRISENSFNVFDPCGRCELSPAYVVCAQQLTLLACFFCGCEGHKCVVVCCSAARNLTSAIPGDKIYLECVS